MVTVKKVGHACGFLSVFGGFACVLGSLGKFARRSLNPLGEGLRERRANFFIRILSLAYGVAYLLIFAKICGF